MKELMVPLLIVLSTGIVVGQQPLQTEENRGSSILDGSSDNFAPLSSTRRLFAEDTEASIQRPTPDFDAPESTTTRQQAGGFGQLNRPIGVELFKIRKIREDGELSISVPANWTDPSSGQRFSKQSIAGLEFSRDDRVNNPNTLVDSISSTGFYVDKETGERVLRFELTEAQLDNVERGSKLKYSLPLDQVGQFDRFEFASRMAAARTGEPVNRQANGSNPNLGNIFPGGNGANAGAQSFQPGPELGSLEFEGPVLPPNMFTRQRVPEQNVNRVATLNQVRPSVNFANNANGFGQDNNGIAPRNSIQFPNRNQAINARPTSNGGNDFAGNNRILPPSQPFSNGVNDGRTGQSQTELTPAQKWLYLDQQRLAEQEKALALRKAQAEAQRQENYRRQANPRFANQSGAFGGDRTDFTQGQTLLPPTLTPPTVVDDTISVSRSRLAALEAAKDKRHAEELEEVKRELARMYDNPNRQFSGLQNASYQQPGNNQRLVSKVSSEQGLGNQANPNSFDTSNPNAMRTAADGSVQVADSRNDVPQMGVSPVDFAKQKAEIERLQLLADDEIRKRKSRESGMFLLLIPSIALNMFLIWMYRSAYVRYDELADDLRETFNSSN